MPHWVTLGNCDICAEQKILFTNETKRYKIWPKPKGCVQILDSFKFQTHNTKAMSTDKKVNIAVT